MPDFLTSPLLASLGVPHAFSLRTGGVSTPPFDSLNLGDAVGDDPDRVARNRTLLLTALGLSPARHAEARQVHGARVVYAVADGELVRLVDEADGGSGLSDPEADALVALPGTSAGVRTADCVPVLLHDPETGLSAAVHAGWKGTAAGIVGEVVERLARGGASRASLRGAVGPAIGACCFEVGDEVARHFDPQEVDRTRGSRPYVDLPAANRRQLLEAGLAPRYVEVLPRCTACDPVSFFSHRRDAGRTGRHLAVIAAGRFVPT